MVFASPGLPFEHTVPHYELAHGLAERLLRHERAGHTLQPTALLHEACLRLQNLPSGRFSQRALLSLYARTMKRVLIDHARRRRARLAATDVAAARLAADKDAAAQVLELERALDRLAVTAPRSAKVVELRFFGGMSVAAAASYLGVTERTVVRDWAEARAMLRDLLAGDERDVG